MVGVLRDPSNEAGLRWFAFFVALTAFAVMLVVMNREQLVLGRITDLKGETCLIVQGEDDEYRVGRMEGAICRSERALFAMENDLRNTPIVWREEYGPAYCLTDDRRSPVLLMELCKQDQPNQRWHLSNHHLVSDAAMHVNDP